MRWDRFAWALLIIATLVLGVVLGRASADPLVPCRTEPGAERTLARLGNEARGRRDVAPLRLDPQLSRVARTHTAAMLAGGALRHSSNEELGQRVTSWNALDENVGIGASAADLHEGFMNSHPHRRTLMAARWRHVGIGALRDDLGRLWVTVVFESRTDPGTRLPRPDC